MTILRVLRWAGIVVLFFILCLTGMLVFARRAESSPTLVVYVNNTTMKSVVYLIEVSGQGFPVLASAQRSSRELLRVRASASHLRVSRQGDVILESEFRLGKDSLFISELTHNTRASLEGGK